MYNFIVMQILETLQNLVCMLLNQRFIKLLELVEMILNWKTWCNLNDEFDIAVFSHLSFFEFDDVFVFQSLDKSELIVEGIDLLSDSLMIDVLWYLNNQRSVKPNEIWKAPIELGNEILPWFVWVQQLIHQYCPVLNRPY